MKKVLITVIVLVLLYPAMAWVTGRVIESRSSTALTELTEKAPYITITENKYHRGWYTSEQDLTVTLFASQMAGMAPMLGANSEWLSKGIPVTFHTVIHHGPICGWSCFGLARTESHLVLPNQAKAAVTLVFGSAEPLTMTSRLGFFGGTSGMITSPALKDVALPGGAKLNWDGITVKTHSTAHFDSYGLDGVAPHLLVNGPNTKQVEVKSIVFKSSSTRALRSVYTGDFEFDVGSVSATDGQGGAAMLVSDIKYGGKASVEAGFYNMVLQMGSGVVNEGATNIKDAHVDFSLKHLDLATLADLTDKMRAFYQKTPPADARENAQALSALLKSQALPLLLKQPVITLDRVGVETASGKILISGSITMPGVTAGDLAGDNPAAALVQKLVADFDVSLDDSALAELPGTAGLLPQLQNLAQQAFFTHDGGHWHTTIHVAQGQSTFNGKVFTAAAMSPPPVAAPMPPPQTHKRP